MRVRAVAVAVLALSVIPTNWREHGSDVIFISTFLGAVSLILAIIWRVFGKRAARWLTGLIQRAMQPILEQTDRYYERRITQLEDRLEELEATNGDNHERQMAVLRAQLEAVLAWQRLPSGEGPIGGD